MKHILVMLILVPLSLAAVEPRSDQGVAIFAGGCFWCTEADFDKVSGVISTTSGYIGGEIQRPSYEQVSRGGTGHLEAVRVVFDPEKTDYAKLLEAFWPTIDPLDAGGQFCDRGYHYRSAIFYTDSNQKNLAQASMKAVAESVGLSGDIVTLILPAGEFWPAEEYHQNYAERNPLRYNYYRSRCGRDQRLKEVWKHRAP
ncbi:MAG: peptide-methionine (S)-S-oxide reductase MsrA [Alcanivoracaceae bacterium]|jgi:peptide-methionine (S)-S-oxide reductase|nr:peptide-methionine (S)-S-oxide reductase MsrA [Alcanivoracaceae bacterium]